MKKKWLTSHWPLKRSRTSCTANVFSMTSHRLCYSKNSSSTLASFSPLSHNSLMASSRYALGESMTILLAATLNVLTMESPKKVWNTLNLARLSHPSSAVTLWWHPQDTQWVSVWPHSCQPPTINYNDCITRQSSAYLGFSLVTPPLAPLMQYLLMAS